MGSLIPWEVLTSMFQKQKIGCTSLNIEALSRNCQIKLLRKMSPKTLFGVFLYSKTIRALYKSVPRGFSATLSLRGDAYIFEMHSETGETCMWEMKTELDELDVKCLESVAKLRTRGVDVMVCWLKDYPNNVFCHHPDLKTVFNAVAALLLRWFCVKEVNIVYNVDANIPRPREFLSDLPSRDTEGLMLMGSSVASEDVKFLLTRFPPQGFFHTDCNITGNVDFVHLIRAKGTFHEQARWLEPEHLLAMRAGFGEFEEAGFMTEHVVRFIRQWLQSDNQSIRTFAIRIRAGLPNLLKSELIQETGAKPWDPKKRDSHNIFLTYHGGQRKVLCTSAEEMIDIERRDGVLASIHMQSNMFCFLIWTDRHPSRDTELRKIAEEQLAAARPGSDEELMTRELLARFQAEN